MPLRFMEMWMNSNNCREATDQTFDAKIYQICKFDAPLEFVFQEQSYSSLHSGQSLAWDHVRSNTDDPCGVIANFCRVITDPCDVAIPKAIGGRRCGKANRCATPLEFFFQEQSYSSLHSLQSLAWDHVRGDIDDPCGAIAHFPELSPISAELSQISAELSPIPAALS